MKKEKTFKIEIKETLSRIIEVKASTIKEARGIVEDRYHNEDIILDADDWVQTDFLNLEE